jgi:anion-transporting  ArsA/GET3 family ATPase
VSGTSPEVAASALAGLVRSRVLLLSGKGGTGKTAVAMALARLTASQGRRTLIVELDAQRPSLGPILGRVPGYAPMVVSPGLSASNLTWAEALDDWLKAVVGAPRVVRSILKNRVVSVFLEATPGARDLVVMTRVAQLAREYDTVVVDMPASGNAVAMLSVAHTAARLFDNGPVRRCADELLALYGRADTRAVLVALPEDMVVNETVETARKLATDVAPLQLGMVVLNRATPPTLTDAERAVLDALLARTGRDVVTQELLHAARWERELEEATAAAQARLQEGVRVPVVTLPALPRGEDAARVVQHLAGVLARTGGLRLDTRGGAA